MKSSSAGEGSKSLSGFFNRPGTRASTRGARVQGATAPSRNTTLPTVRREKARRLARPGESPGKLLGRLRKAKQPRESEILDHNLRTIGHVPVASERPNIRKSALRLERRYRSAMAVVDGRDPAQSVAETIDRIASQPAGESEVATDYLACCSTVGGPSTSGGASRRR
ncbi:hypothetical protein JL720_10538 [Aureococcus anophagefferens]|nr:hypothetical protein JL720_10538 [Aureococcus anophagefferens]